MASYSTPEVVLVRYPFSDLTGAKVRPAVVVSASHVSQDLLIVPLTSKTGGLLAGEFVLAEWNKAGLNIETAVKRGVYIVFRACHSWPVNKRAFNNRKAQARIRPRNDLVPPGKPGKSFSRLGTPRCCIAISPKTDRKSVVSARSRFSYSFSGARPGHSP